MLHGIRHLVPRRYPCFDASLERPHFSKPFVYHQAGDTRRAGFVGSTAVDDDLGVGWHVLQHALHIRELD